MAKKSKTPDLFETLRASGLRKRVARDIAGAVEKAGDSASRRTIERRVRDLRAIVTDLEDRATGRSSKRSEAARKAAATRRRKAAKRSTAAKKAARTRARS